MRKLLKFIPIIVFSFACVAQEENLVPNGSFEMIEGKIKALGCIENALGWSSPTGARADLFSPSKVLEANVPENNLGKEEAKEGKCYAGITAFSFGDALPRTYLMAKLSTPLKKGMKYCVKFNLSLAESSKYACNQIGVNLAPKPFGTDSKTAIIEKTHVLDSRNKIFNAMYNWDIVCGIYYAEGGEKYITIGNFTSNENTKNEKNKKDAKNKTPQITAAYYFIDDVSVTLISDEAACDCAGGQNESTYSTTIYQKVVNLNDAMSPKEKIELQTEYFGFGKSKLTPTSTQSLDLIATLLKANPALKLEIIGHSDEEEDKLVQEKPAFADMDSKRVNEVMKYLESKGIPMANLIAATVGNSEPSSEISEGDDDDLKMAKNRRVTFKVR